MWYLRVLASFSFCATGADNVSFVPTKARRRYEALHMMRYIKLEFCKENNDVRSYTSLDIRSRRHRFLLYIQFCFMMSGSKIPHSTDNFFWISTHLPMIRNVREFSNEIILVAVLFCSRNMCAPDMDCQTYQRGLILDIGLHHQFCDYNNQ